MASRSWRQSVFNAGCAPRAVLLVLLISYYLVQQGRSSTECTTACIKYNILVTTV